jgi:hypothetical protein
MLTKLCLSTALLLALAAPAFAETVRETIEKVAPVCNKPVASLNYLELRGCAGLVQMFLVIEAGAAELEAKHPDSVNQPETRPATGASRSR